MPDIKKCPVCGNIYSYKLNKFDEWIPFCNKCDYEKNMGKSVLKKLKKICKSLGWEIK